MGRFTGVAVAALLLGCGDSGGTSDGGSGGMTGASGASSGADAGTSTTSGSGSASTGDSPTTGAVDDCASDEFWTMGEFESPLMHPGRACLNCHQSVVGEDIQGRFGIAGTVYPTLHEVDDCYGAAAPGLQVVIDTEDNQTLTLPVNGAGNFMYDQLELGAFMFPITARVVRGDLEIAMATPQMSGDCNSCHTEQGANGAPGRILAP